MAKTCANCGASAADYAAICPACKTKFPPPGFTVPPARTKLCPTCQASQAADAVFCNKCGATFPPSEPAPATVAPIPQPIAPKKGGIPVWGWIIIGVVGLLVVIGIASSGSKSSGTATPTGSNTQVASAAPTTAPAKVAPTATPMAKIGETITAGNWTYQVSKTSRDKTITWSTFGNKTDAKGIWQIVQIKIQNIGKQTYPINAWDFEIKDDGGITYKADSVTSSEYASFNKLSKPSDNYPPGVPAEIGVVFDINPEAKGLKLNLVQAKQMIDLGQ